MSADTVRLLIPLDSVAMLPGGASYTARKGKASVKVSLKPVGEGRKSAIVVESACDSLMQQCMWYESRNDSLMRQIDTLAKLQQRNATSQDVQTKKEQRSNIVITILAGWVLGFIALIAIELVVLGIKDRKNHKNNKS